MKSRYLSIIIICGILALLALGGQLKTAPSDELPVRIRLDNKAGDVVFNHFRHVQYEIVAGDCAKCHHEKQLRFAKAGKADAPILPCGSCHAAEFNAQFSAKHQKELPQETCVGCHHAALGKLSYSHKDHAEKYTSGCTDCHHGPEIEPKPGACKQCHGEKTEGGILSLREAVHAKCGTCHQDLYDAKLSGCIKCHEMLPGKATAPQPACNSCHYEKKAVPLPNRKQAFHDQCLKCHEQAGAGPYDNKSCKRCHTR